MLVDAHRRARITSAPMSQRVLCLGEPVVDLVCERQVTDVTAADAFVPRLGGAAATVAAVAAGIGAPVTVAGGAGEDAWGRWAVRRLARAGVETSLLSLLPGARTQLAFVIVDGSGEPAYTVYGDHQEMVVPALGERLQDAVSAARGLFVTSTTLVGPGERALTMRARQLALDAGLPVVFDPNVRLDRWRSAADAAASVNALVPGALLVRANLAQATLMTGESDPERAAVAMLKAGARLVAITLGADGAMLRGELRADVDGFPARVASTVGAGDVFTGVLLGRLALSDFYPPVVAASMREAVGAASAACERWGALD